MNEPKLPTKEQATLSRVPVDAEATLPPSSAPDEDAAAPVQPILAGYQIECELGRGGMGVVYQAIDIRLKRRVALKMILAGGHAGQADLARFRTEARFRTPVTSAGVKELQQALPRCDMAR
jgi:serine/threonine protein kinase